MVALPDVFLERPLAHRGLHSYREGVIENSASAFRAAIAKGYGIELDVQLTGDSEPVVFHDYDLRRLTPTEGPVRQVATSVLLETPLKASTDRIERLCDILDLIAGRVPVLIELKDQDGEMGPDIGPLEEAVARDLARYDGPAALMSFNPNATALMAKLCPDHACGLVTSNFNPKYWPLPEPVCDHLREIPDFEASGASFISHEHSDLSRPRVAELKAKGARVLCWTIRSQAEADSALKIADNITFEGFHPS